MGCGPLPRASRPGPRARSLRNTTPSSVRCRAQGSAGILSRMLKRGESRRPGRSDAGRPGCRGVSRIYTGIRGVPGWPWWSTSQVFWGAAAGMPTYPSPPARTVEGVVSRTPLGARSRARSPGEWAAAHDLRKKLVPNSYAAAAHDVRKKLVMNSCRAATHDLRTKLVLISKIVSFSFSC